MASVDGMNGFSASIVLCQVSLEDFLNIEPEERIDRFGGFMEGYFCSGSWQRPNWCEKEIEIELMSQALQYLILSD